MFCCAGRIGGILQTAGRVRIAEELVWARGHRELLELKEVVLVDPRASRTTQVARCHLRLCERTQRWSDLLRY